MEGLPAAFRWLWLGALVNRMGGFVVPFLAIYLTEARGASVAQAGAIASAWGLGAVASGPVAGALADRLGRRATLLGALLVAGVGMIGLGFVTRLEVLGPAVFLLGFASDAFRPAMQAAVADLVPDPAARLRAYGLVYWAANLGFAVALVTAGLLARLSFTLLFVLDGATTLLFAGIVLAKVPETNPAAPARVRDAGLGAALRAELAGLAAPFADRALLDLILLNLVFAALLWQSHAALPIDMRAHGLSPAAYGALMALNGLVIVVAQPLVTRWAARRDGGRVLAGGGALTGLGWGMNAVASGALGYGAAIVVWTVGEVLVSPTAQAVVATLAPAHRRGRYQGAFGMSWAVAAAAGPAAGAWMLERHGAPALWAGCLAAGALMAGGHLAAARARRGRGGR